MHLYIFLFEGIKPVVIVIVVHAFYIAIKEPLKDLRSLLLSIYCVSVYARTVPDYNIIAHE